MQNDNSRGQGPIRGDVFPWWLLTLEALALVAMIIVAANWLGGCHPGELAKPCDTGTLETLKADCRARVRAECPRDAGVVDESCPALRDCDARIKQWLACADGGAQ